MCMTTLNELTNAVIAFRDERHWKQFDNPKDVAISLLLEAAEFLELFQRTPGVDVATDVMVVQGPGVIPGP